MNIPVRTTLLVFTSLLSLSAMAALEPLPSATNLGRPFAEIAMTLDTEVDAIITPVYAGRMNKTLARNRLFAIESYLKNQLDSQNPFSAYLTNDLRSEALRILSVAEGCRYNALDGGRGTGEDGFDHIRESARLCPSCSKSQYGYGLTVLTMDQKLSGLTRAAVEWKLDVKLGEELGRRYAVSWGFWNDVKNLMLVEKIAQVWQSKGVQFGAADLLALNQLKARIQVLAAADPATAEQVKWALKAAASFN